MAAAAMTPGLGIWIGIGTALLAWTVVSAVSANLPGPIALVRWFAQSWLGRVLALCAWAGAGWHLFCQRP
jgi:hypothetical protein